MAWNVPHRRALLKAAPALAAPALAAPALAAGPSAARPPAPYRWRNVRVGGGGFIPGVVFSRAEQGLAYARSDMGGAYRWTEAEGGWTPLQDGMAEGSYYGVESIAPDPHDPDVVHAAVGVGRTQPAAMLFSSDRGATWRVTPVPFRMGGNEDGRGLGERLAVDPSDGRRLWFASRHDGLMRSDDQGLTWRRIESFPVRGLGAPDSGTQGGLAFVVFDRADAGPTVVVGVADPGGPRLFRSDDGGETWRPLPAPADPFSAAKAAVDGRGVMLVTFTHGIGPNGVTDGQVWRYDLRAGTAADVSPPRPPGDRAGGFMGVDADHGRPGVWLVSTMNRWQPGDTLWRTTDDGRTWTSLRERAVRDVETAPFLYWGRDQPDFGWWIAALAIDPFDGDRAVYGTGATLYATRNLSDHATRWTPWVEGIEQTAVIGLTSPAEGPPLLSAFGDISGFAHEDLDVSPRRQFTTPVFANTNQIDWAGLAPLIVVRSGTPHEGVGSEDADGSTLAWSEDGGLSWKPLGRPRPAGGGDAPSPWHRRMDLYRDAPITLTADGSAFLLATPQPMRSTDRGATWRAIYGLPVGARPTADRADPMLAYALHVDDGTWRVSTDGGASFAPVASHGLPADVTPDRWIWREQFWPLRATPGRAGDLWFVSKSGLFHSEDGGQRWAGIGDEAQVEQIDFGAPLTPGGYPALYAIATQGGVRGIFRSDDAGHAWTRVNDDAHEYGRRYRAIAGDPRRPGRVYLATDGRGVVYGEPR